MIKALDRFLRSLAPHFHQGGRLQRWYPLYEATDSFLMGSRLTNPGAPHVRDAIDFKRIMITVIIALIPCVLMALWNTGYQANLALVNLGLELPAGWRGVVMSRVGVDPASLSSNLVHGALYFLPVYLVCVVVGSVWETIFNIIRGHEFSEAFLVTSLLLPLTLPPTIPLWQVAVGTSFGVIFAKEVFGGVGRNFMNPALTARAFLFFAYPAEMSGDEVWVGVDGLSSATPLATLAAAPADQPVAALDFTWGAAFAGIIPGSMGETSALACLLGAALLLVTRIASWRIMLAMLLGALACSLPFWLIGSPDNPMANVPPHWHLVLGGFALGLVFMATDPVTAPHTEAGKWLYGLFIGALTIILRVLNPAFPEGVMLAILLGNIFAPLFDYLVIQANIRRRALRYG
ncbi:NADH:ubiquinone oxidoreductase, subunit B [Desulfurivibrio alkaliphilus AHT 2]|uniref:Na(+)-translocating NADH-quinone reductase subunit B n=1 Tax=Desulfurivibrio alkaliphilus (strain DSM 19089 / UNIQEM U267 / AHT2) TaxID=589865 RepID=D6Z5A0_DESAT|nr:NADH:ubiquinone reductase (Na(+)-transporting) subunit B [Desulfurivibrio alkaliphilus]ADH84757.1 NADH:ubiquinone oxidoreductase, subunit B [Desulfurivibrio alkaliphilus AHT 2]